MAIIAGIDEAGYGPLLGPLVVSAVSFELPESLLKADLWKTLKDSVSKSRQKTAGRIVIADSKKVYTPAAGIFHLRRSVLAALHCLGHTPRDLEELSAVLDPEVVSRLGGYPWFQRPREHVLEHDASDVALAGSVFARDMEARNIRLVGICSKCLDVAHYNGLVRVTNNKATVSFAAVLQLATGIIRQAKGQTAQIVVDRQGGRTDYVQPLRLNFPGAALSVIRQDESISSYQLEWSDRIARLHFIVKGDDRSLPVALASMTSKYLREEMMHCMNRHFATICPELKATAGYWKDGGRFIEDLKRLAPEAVYDPELMIRCR